MYNMYANMYIICIIYKIQYVQYSMYNMYCKYNSIFMMYLIRIYIFIINISFTTHCLYVSTNCQILTISHNLVPPLAQHLFNEIYVEVSDLMQFVFVKSSSNRLSARIFQKIRHSISCTLIEF